MTKLYRARLARKIKGRLTRYVNDLKNGLAVRRLDPFASSAFSPGRDSNLIVSLTSFPARIDSAWITIETLFQQTFRPSKIVLVLAEEDFFYHPRLPAAIEAQRDRGLSILWIEKNIKSYKKLLPVVERYGGRTIVTVDDDVFYEPQMLEGLVSAHRKDSRQIVGNVGRVVPGNVLEAGGYNNWPKADLSTPSEDVFLVGVGGVLYPPESLSSRLWTDIELANQLCPTGDDIWFWAVSVVEGIGRRCLGSQPYRELKVQRMSPALTSLNRGLRSNDKQLENVINYFEIQR
ncbi:MAG: hypothetical protein JJU22_14025 [Gammaproteobacteria bacterium]|nr:hypothetical protein [Gammaproteobacteria bacterium]